VVDTDECRLSTGTMPVPSLRRARQLKSVHRVIRRAGSATLRARNLDLTNTRLKALGETRLAGSAGCRVTLR
jgi:hypothetical protein